MHGGDVATERQSNPRPWDDAHPPYNKRSRAAIAGNAPVRKAQSLTEVAELEGMDRYLRQPHGQFDDLGTDIVAAILDGHCLTTLLCLTWHPGPAAVGRPARTAEKSSRDGASGFLNGRALIVWRDVQPYESVRDRQILKRHFQLDDIPESGKWDMWPGYLGPFIRRHEFADVGTKPFLNAKFCRNSFGLIRTGQTITKIARRTYSARSGSGSNPATVTPGKGHHCIIPADTFYEPDWRSAGFDSVSVPMVGPMGIAGLWSWW